MHQHSLSSRSTRPNKTAFSGYVNRTWIVTILAISFILLASLSIHMLLHSNFHKPTTSNADKLPVRSRDVLPASDPLHTSPGERLSVSTPPSSVAGSDTDAIAESPAPLTSVVINSAEPLREQRQQLLVEAASRAQQTVFAAKARGYGAGGYDDSQGMTPSRSRYTLDNTGYSPPVNWNTEEYEYTEENAVKAVSLHPTSTFSIDADAASYANVRRFITNGSLPPASAVRLEEMINYFNYNYPQPEGNLPFEVVTELSACPWNDQRLLLHVGLQGKHVDVQTAPASNLVFLIDVSGSMSSPDKLELVKTGFTMLVNQLRPKDRVAIVVYAGSSGLVLESTPGKHKETILESIGRLQSGGSTAGGEGIQLAYKVAEENFIRSGNNRVILATDGDFNVGVSNTGDLTRMIEEKREGGVFLSVLGVGRGNLNDHLMESLADHGNGNYNYLDNAMEAERVLVGQMAGTLYTIAKDVKIQVEFNPAKVKGYRLVGYENRMLAHEDFTDDKKDAGELGSGHTVTALYEIIPVDSPEMVPTGENYRYQTTSPISHTQPDFSEEWLTVKLRYKQPDGDVSALIEHPLSGTPKQLTATSDAFRFSAAVAEFGMLLKESDQKQDASFEQALSLARGARGADEDGFRAEFIRLVETAAALK